jgi:hypothetical protein
MKILRHVEGATGAFVAASSADAAEDKGEKQGAN